MHRRLACARRRSRLGVDRRAAVAAGLEVGEDVGLAHAPAAAGALDPLEVDAVLGGDPHHHGRVAAWAGAPGRGGAALGGPGVLLGGVALQLTGLAGGLQRDLRLGRAPAGGLALGRVRLAGLGVGRDAGEHDADVDRRADLDQHLLHAPAGGRLDVGVDLVGGDRGDDLVALDPVAGLLLPLDDGALGDRDAHLGHRHVNVGNCR